MASNPETIRAVKTSLSAARMSTFEIAAGVISNDDPRALSLYAWNAQVSAALLAPLHICEIVMRNAVSEAIEIVYGPRWPWSIGFEQSLPASRSGYNPQRDLQNARSHATSTGKVIPELKFVFWQKMFTSRHDSRLWNPYLRQVLPNLDPDMPIENLRTGIYNDLEQIRNLRNRIAHHEPIFSRNLKNDFSKIASLIAYRSIPTAHWMQQNQQASGMIEQRP